MFYKIFASRDRNIRQSVATCRCEVLPSFASAVIDILLYLISFSSVLDNKKLLNLIRWLVKDKVNF